MYIYVKYFTWCNLINLVDNAYVDTAYITPCMHTGSIKTYL